MKTSLPYLLIYSRIVIGFVIIGLSTGVGICSKYWIAGLIFLGLLTDVFDGVFARMKGISSEDLRVWDSNVDQFFWLAIFASIVYLRFESFKVLWLGILFILILEVLAYLFSYLKFNKPIATHSILAKIWTIFLFFFLMEVLVFDTSNSFTICLILGLISRVEIIAIIAKLNQWVTDVPSIFVVAKINNGVPLKKGIWF